METEYMDIEYMGKTVQVLQYLSESNKEFNERLSYIRNLESKGVDWKEAQRQSKLWYCVKFKKCKYPQYIYKTLIQN